MGKQVYKLGNANQAIAAAVQIGTSDAKYAELIGGELKEGDAVILEDVNQNNKKDMAKGNFRVKAL